MLAAEDHNMAVSRGPLPKNMKVVDALCEYLASNWQGQPDLEVMSQEIGYSPHHIQKAFSDWAGISPKDFIAALNLQEARKMLRDGESLLETSYRLGMSGPGRLHDLFIKKEAMTPGAYKKRGEGLSIDYGFEDTLFGRCLFMYLGDFLAGISFCTRESEEEALADMKARWPLAQYVYEPRKVSLLSAPVFTQIENKHSIKVVLIGSDFDISVWEALTKIPLGATVSYSNIASILKKPKAVRAVASAVGRNPISFVVPCHRVLRRDGMLGGYHWGLARKCALIGFEKTMLTD